MDDLGNVFLDLGFTPGEAENLKIRSDLMDELKLYIKDNKMSQREAAKLFKVTQPRISNLVRGRIDLFSIDTLINMAACAGLSVHLSIRKAPVYVQVQSKFQVPNPDTPETLVEFQVFVNHLLGRF